MEDPEGEKATLTLSHSPTEQSVDEKHPFDSAVPKFDEVTGISPQEEAAGTSPAVGVQFHSSNPMEGEEADVPESADTSDELHIPTYSEVKGVSVFDALCTGPESNQLNSPLECIEDLVCLHSFPLPESEQIPIFDTMEAGEEPHKMSTEEVEVLAYETSSLCVQHNYRMFEEVGEVLGSKHTSLPKKDMEASLGLAEVGDELIDGDSEEVKVDPDIARAVGSDGISDYEIEIAGGLVEAAVKEFAEEAVESAGDDMEAACSGDIASENEFSVSVDMKKGGRGRKRARRSSKLEGAKFPSQKKDEEEVCFICFDGGDLVVCDRRGCPKVYHPSCVNRKEAYFQSKGQWSCGWHLCSKCQKSACYKCYTCTYSLCKSCVNVEEFTCIRGNKGFCAACLTTILLMETSENANEKKDGVDFNDRSCWEYLFKDYWYELKQKLLMNVDELTKDRTASKVSDLGSGDEVSSDNAQDASSDRSSACHDGSISSKKKLKLTKPNARKILRKADQTDGFSPRDDNSFRKRTKSSFRNATPDSLKKERKVESSCQENSLMIKEKKRPRKNTSKVGTVNDTESELSVHQNNSSRTKSKSKSRKPVEENKLADACEEQTTVVECTDWASKELLEFISHVKNGDKSILSLYDVQELLLDYVKVNKLRDPRKKSQIICDSMLLTLFDKTRVGHFEMLKLLESHFLIKISSPCSDENQGGDTSLIELGSELINDLEGMMNTSKQQISRKRVESKPQTNLYSYAAVDVHNINLMYLRRSLMEELIDDMSTFSEKVIGSFVRIRVTFSSQKQEVYRLVQVVGCGKATEEYKTGKRTTDVMLEIINLDKKEIITVDIISNQEFTEEECKRLRQSIKFGFISRLTVGEVQEKARVLQSVRINDNLESEKLRFTHLRDRASEKGRKKEHRECVEKLHLLCSPEEHMKRLNEVAQAHADPKMDPDYESPEDDGDDEIKEGYPDRPMQTFKEDVGNPDRPMQTFKERELNVPGKEGSSCNWSGVAKSLNSAIVSPPKNFEHNIHVETKKIEEKVEALLDDKEPATESAVLPEPKLEASSAKVVSQPNASESEKIWHYKDPSGKIQGPFSVVQLRKWSKHFPSNLSIWKKSERQEDSILLTDALVGNFQKDLPEWVPMNSVHLSSPVPPISSCKLPENTTSLQNDKAAGGAACIDSIRNLDNKHNTWSNDFCKISRNEQIVAHVLNSEPTQQASYQPIDVHNRPLIISSDLDPRKKFFEEPILTRGTGDTIQKHDLAGHRSSDRCFDHGIKAKTEKVIDHSASSTESNTVPEVSQCDNTCTSLQKVGTSDARPIVESNVLVSVSSQISDAHAFPKPGPETSKSAYASTSIQNAGTFANSASGHLPTYMVPQTIVSCNWNQPTANLGEQSAPILNSTTMLSGINVGVSTSVNCQATPLLSSDGTKPFISPQLNNSASTVTYQPPNMNGWGAVTTEINNPGWQVQTQYQNQSNMAAAVGNLLCGAGVQGGLVNNNNNTNVGWGMMAQGNNMNTPWVVAPNVNTAWNQGLTLPPQGNAPFIGPPPQGNVAPYQMWSAPVQMNSNQNHVRPAPVVAKTNPITHANNAATKENPSSSNVQSERSSDRNFGLADSGFRGGRPGYGPGRQSRNWMASGNVERSSRPQEHTGICSYHMQGHCKKGSSCNYIHS